jgi:hypothetical protein
MPRTIVFTHQRIPLPALQPAVPHTISVDCDVDRDGNAVIAAQAGDGIDLHFLGAGTKARFAKAVRYPRVCAIGTSRALLCDLRSDVHDKRAWVIGENGGTEREFAIGDAVEDVIWTREHLVASYFDEGALGEDPLSTNGIAIFGHDGDLRWGWNATDSPGVPPIYDCYAAAEGPDDTIGALIYTNYKGDPYAFGSVDLVERAVTIFSVPRILYATRATTCTPDGTWFFVSRSMGDAVGSIVAWRPGSPLYTAVRAPLHLSRGLAGGRFIGIDEQWINVISVTLQGDVG